MFKVLELPRISNIRYSCDNIRVCFSLERGLKIANQIDNSKFRLLINRICQTLQAAVDAKVFSEEEEEKLLVSLDLNKDDLGFLLDAIVQFYKQAACNIVKSQLMENTLKDTFKIDDDKVQIFVNAWVAYGKGIIDNFRQKSIFPVQVCRKDALRRGVILLNTDCPLHTFSRLKISIGV